MTIGCLLAGGGILLASAVLGPHVDFGTLGWVLPIAGIGIGMLLVPVTSVPLTVVPPERSGMAASATNTSREMGAVFGVAILGCHRQRQAHRRPGGAAQGHRHPAQLPEPGPARHPDRGCEQRRGGEQRRALEERRDRPDRHQGRQRRLRRVRLGFARGAGRVRQPHPGRRRRRGPDDPPVGGDLRALSCGGGVGASGAAGRARAGRFSRPSQHTSAIDNGEPGNVNESPGGRRKPALFTRDRAKNRSDNERRVRGRCAAQATGGTPCRTWSAAVL